MAQPFEVIGRRPKTRGLSLVALALVAVGAVAVAATLLYYGRFGGGSTARPTREAPGLDATVFTTVTNGAARIRLPVDEDAALERKALLDRLRAEEQARKALEQRLAALEARRKEGRPATEEDRPARPKVHQRTSLVYFQREDRPPTSDSDTFLLLPNTKIPCALEANLNSDIPGLVTAKVTHDVFDSASLRVPLIPQGADLQVVYGREKLLYGAERLEVGLEKVILPRTQRVIELKAPGADQMGAMGWTGEVDHHFWRLAKAVLLRGALAGSAQVIQRESTALPGAGPVVGQIAREGSQAGQRQTQPYIQAAPTIRKDGGERCLIILRDTIRLPAAQESVDVAR